MKGSPQKKNLKTFLKVYSLTLFSLFVMLFIVSLVLKYWNVNNFPISSPITVKDKYNYPILKADYLPQLSATGSIIMDAKTKAVVYSKNPKIRFSSASTTKIMTAIVALDHFKLNEVLTVKDVSREGSILGVYEGQQFTLEALLYALLLPSSNDVALVIAQNYPGGEKEFVNQMNKKAEVYLLSDTHFGDPSGLEDSLNYTTPFDLARLASFALDYPEFARIVSTKYITITDINSSSVYELENLNRLLGLDGVTGVKTGYTEEAGQVLVTSKQENGNTIIIVVMGSQDRFFDTQLLLSLIRGNLTFLPIHP
jgi:serine-type D-Ala-D-Ala carboxypeptidase (penicillin-binding protein 5/6)